MRCQNEPRAVPTLGRSGRDEQQQWKGSDDPDQSKRVETSKNQQKTSPQRGGNSCKQLPQLPQPIQEQRVDEHGNDTIVI
mmetsp:Transcript_14629/g.26492  ORF Transcript_14629/g.26492 Transcript_14629/m.26492 type:complete len:80 (-) Transcript_14629:631-870(-)